MTNKQKFFIRRAHRFLGVFIGIQFLLWTVSGLYFSWANHDTVVSKPYKKDAAAFAPNVALASPTAAIDSLKKQEKLDSLATIRLIEIGGRPVYQIQFFADGKRKTRLADASTATLREPLSKNEAVALAQNRFSESAQVADIQYLTKETDNEEYRDDPLPAYAVTFAHPNSVTIFVSAEHGTIEKYRNDTWRIYDLLWMAHTMDYRETENINNWLLRVFSVFSLVTVLSGFTLFFVSAKWRKK